VRSCFRSRWRLFRGRSESTAGQYIFADENTPCYPGWHLLWSRDWVTDELEGATLGEDPAARRSYALGDPLGPIAAPDVLGDPDCIANGAAWPLTVVPVLRGGFDARCAEEVPAPYAVLDVRDPANWCFWAQIAQQTYTDGLGARARVAGLLGVVDSGYLQSQPVGLVPPWWLLTSAAPEPAVIVIAGTSTVLQWLTQIFDGARPPQDFAAFSSSLVWYRISSYLLNALLPFAIPSTQDIIIVGHSLGAAVAAVLAARFRLQSPARTIQVMLLGCPRPGDERLRQILTDCEVVTIVNEGDLIPGIPNNLAEIPALLQPILAPFYPPGAALWAPPPNPYVVAWDGTITPGAAQPGGAGPVTQILLWALSAAPFPDFSPHLPGEYARRLCSPVRMPIAWLDSTVFTQPDGALVVAGPNLADVSNGFYGDFPSGNLAQMRRERDYFATALVFRNVTGFTLAHPVCIATDWEFASAMDVVREFGDAGQEIWAAPMGATGGAPGPSFIPLSGLSGEWRVTARTSAALLPWGGGNGAPLLASGLLEDGLVSAQLETGESVDQASAGGASPYPSGFTLAGGGFTSPFPVPFPQLWIGEALLFLGALTSQERASVWSYLRMKWMMHLQALTTEDGDTLTTEDGEALGTD
jgi:Lipase (class 3)